MQKISPWCLGADDGLTYYRLAVWYTIITTAFRCPSSPADLTEDSPKLCKPYLDLKSHATPYLEPYYNAHLAPYVEKVQPYVDRVKTQAYDPALAFTTTNYEKHGAPRVAQAQKYGQAQWDKTLRPQVEVARQAALKQYNIYLGPHVQKVTDVASPYYNNVKTSATDFYELEVRPAYKLAAPHVKRTYKQVEAFAVNTAFPYAQWSGELTWTFVRRQIWPKIQILYGENVEPQVMKITQRLGRYKDEKKLEAAVESIAASSQVSSATPILSSASSAASSIAASVTSAISSGSVPAVPSASVEPEQSAGEQFTADLKLWDEQVSKAVEEGSEHLRERVDEIAQSQVDHQVTAVGKALLIELEEGSKSALNSLKTKIQSIVEDLPEEATDSDVSAAEEKLTKAVRSAGKTVKNKAQDVRDWKQSFEKQTTELVDAAVHSTLETIGNIQDLRLQDIGRRWAHHESITHKDWSKYNDLKKASSKWKGDVEAVASKHQHITEAKKVASDIEEQAMATAEDAATELARLKSVGQWKIGARDASDDFNTKHIPAAAAKAKQAVMDKVSDAKEAVAPSSQGTIESLSSVASSKAAGVASSASIAAASASSSASSVAASVSAPSAESVVSAASSKAAGVSSSAESAASEASKKIIGTQTGSVESVASAASEKIVGTQPGSVESAASAASEKIIGTQTGSIESAASKASEAIIGTEQPAVESVRSVVAESASSVASAVSESVIGTEPGVVEKAATKASEAVIGTEQPALESVTSVVAESASSVASAVSESVIGTEPGVAEKAATKASEAIIGTEIPAIESISSAVKSGESSVSASLGPKAASALAEANSMKDQVSSSVIGTSTPAAESVVSEASSSLSSVASVASEAVAGSSSSNIAEKASKKVMGGVMAQAVPEVREIVFDDEIEEGDTYSDKVQSIMSKAGDHASYLTQAVQDAIKPTTTQGKVQAASSLANDQYLSAVEAASSMFFGEEETMPESMARVASERYTQAVQA